MTKISCISNSNFTTNKSTKRRRRILRLISTKRFRLNQEFMRVLIFSAINLLDFHQLSSRNGSPWSLSIVPLIWLMIQCIFMVGKTSKETTKLVLTISRGRNGDRLFVKIDSHLMEEFPIHASLTRRSYIYLVGRRSIQKRNTTGSVSMMYGCLTLSKKLGTNKLILGKDQKQEGTMVLQE